MIFLTLLCFTNVLNAPAMGATSPVLFDMKQSEKLFEEFIETFSKLYSSNEEKQMRYNIFKKTLEEINHLNSVDTATFGINEFADLTKEEFIRQHMGQKLTPFGNVCSVKTDDDILTHDAPASFDWRDRGAVTDVKRQGSCDAGWVFAIIGVIEGQYAKKNGGKLELSAQELVDCLYDCEICCHCDSNKAMRSLIDLGGVQLDSDYPYVGKEQRCRYKPSLAKVKPIGCTNYNLQDENKLKELLAKTGPLYIAIDGTSLKKYSGGILKNCAFSKKNHAVLLIGYGSEDGVDYWLIKNSWGYTWGEHGFGKIRRGVNACGLMNECDTASITIE